MYYQRNWKNVSCKFTTKSWFKGKKRFIIKQKQFTSTGKEILTFGDTEIEKNEFYYY